MRRRYPNKKFSEDLVIEDHDIFSLPYKSSSIDEVKADGLLEHLSFKEEPKFLNEMFRVLNCGIGMAVICTPNNVAELTNCFQNAGEQVFEIGYIKSNAGFTETILNNCDEPWQQK